MSSEKDLEKFIREKVDQSTKAFNSKKDASMVNLQAFTGAAFSSKKGSTSSKKGSNSSKKGSAKGNQQMSSDNGYCTESDLELGGHSAIQQDAEVSNPLQQGP